MTGGERSTLAAEVLFLEAPAAVGKSTTARALSARTGAPLLDLAKVPVSTKTLVGLLGSELSGPGDPVAAFHMGDIPVIVDAPDEGRLLSGEEGFEGFLETTGELLLESRAETSRPKLVFLGRPGAIAFTKTGLQLAGQDLTMASVEVDFFRESAARKLIHAYADADSAASSPTTDRKRTSDVAAARRSLLLKLMVTHDLASKEEISASGEKKVQIRFTGSWEELRRAIRGEDVSDEYTAFLRAARKVIQ